MADPLWTALMSLKDNGRCFACGRDNPAGLRVDFVCDRENRTIRGRFVPHAVHQGYEDIVHGGILSTLLDEAMVKLAFLLGMPSVTAEMTVKFRAPAAPGDELSIIGVLRRESRRLIEAEARIERAGKTIAEATAKLMRG